MPSQPTQPAEPTKYLTPAEVADILRLKPYHVVNLCRSGELRATKPFGQWRIAEADLAAAIEKGYEKAQRASDAA